MTEKYTYIFRDANGHRVGDEYEDVVVAREVAFHSGLILIKLVYRAVEEVEIKDYSYRKTG